MVILSVKFKKSYGNQVIFNLDNNINLYKMLIYLIFVVLIINWK